MILHAGIRPIIVSLLLLVHPGKNHPLPPEKRLTMTKKSCHDSVGNIGICMFKYDCIRQKGITLTTCVDGFLFGACCMLKGEHFQEDSRENFISQSYSLLSGINFLTTPTFSKENAHSAEELDSGSYKPQTLIEEKTATTDIMALRLTTKEHNLFNSSELILESDNTESVVSVFQTDHLPNGTSSDSYNYSSSLITVTEDNFSNHSISNITESTNNIESTTKVLNRNENNSYTPGVNTLSNFTEVSLSLSEVTSENDKTGQMHSLSSLYFETTTTPQFSFNYSSYTVHINEGLLLEESMNISSSTVDLSDNTKEENTTNIRDITNIFILPNPFLNVSSQNINGNESDKQTTHFETTISSETDNDNARPFSHSPLNWVPDHIVPESFQSVIAQLTSNEMSSPLNISYKKPAEVNNINNTIDSHSQVSLTDNIIDDSKDGLNYGLLYKNGQTTASILNTEPGTKPTVNKFEVLDSELFQDKNESLLSDESTVYSTFYDVMNMVNKVTVGITLTASSGFGSSDKSNLTRVDELSGATQLNDIHPIEIVSTQNPLNSTYIDDSVHENSPVFTSSVNLLTLKETESNRITESSDGESYSITLPDFNLSTDEQIFNGSLYEENTDARISIQDTSIDLQDNILSSTLSPFEESIFLIDNKNSTEDQGLVQKEVQNLIPSSSLNAIVSDANEFPFKGTELPFDELITPSQTHTGSSHLDTSTKAEYVSKIFYSTTSPLTPLSSSTSENISNIVSGNTDINLDIIFHKTENESYDSINLSLQTISFINSAENSDIQRNLSLGTEENFSLTDQNDSTTSFNENYSTNSPSEKSDSTHELQVSTPLGLNSANFQSTQLMNLLTSDLTTHQTSTYIENVYHDNSSSSDTLDLSTDISYISNKISQTTEPSIPSSTISENLISHSTSSENIFKTNTTENTDSSNESGLFTTPFVYSTTSPEDTVIQTSSNGNNYIDRTESAVTLLESNSITSPNYYNEPESSSSEHSSNITIHSGDSSNLDNHSESSLSVHPSNLNSVSVSPSTEYPSNLNNESVSSSFSVNPPNLDNNSISSLGSTLPENNVQSYESASTLTIQSNVEEITVYSEVDSYQYGDSNGSSLSEGIPVSSLNNNQTTLSTQTVTSNGTSPQPTTQNSASTAMDFDYTTPLHRWNYKKDCGIRLLQPLGRIVGGKNSYYGKWPWQALVKEATWLGLFVKNKCGGVLINAKYVLTAAHCQPGFFASLLVILGTHDLAGTFDNKVSIIRNVKRMVVHRHYNAQTFENDLALLEMETKVEFLPHVVPICLPHRNEDFTGKMAFVTGWGKLTHGGDVPNILQEVQVPIVENEDCQRMFYHAGHKKSIRSNFVCAGYTNGGQDSCEGDSGGPLMVQREDKRWVLVGTVSHGIGCADPNLPGVYMRMSAYRPWIDSIIKKP